MSDATARVPAVTQVEPNRVKVMFAITPDLFKDGLRHAYEENKKDINLPGFRRGKAPRKLIEARYGKEFFYDDALNHILPQTYQEAIDQTELDIVSRPEFKVLSVSEEQGADVEALVWTKPKAVISQYKGLGYRPMDVTVSDEMVQREIDRELEKNSRFIPIKDRPLQDGDVANIDFVGYVDGAAFEGGNAEAFELTIGSGRFIPGFEEKIIGMNVGENRSIDVVFPNEYHAEHLQGKPAQFEVKLNECHIKEVPEADDDFAQNVSDFDTFEEYKNDVRAKIKERLEHQAEHEKEEAVVSELINSVEADIPEAMVETEVDHIVNNFARNLTSRGMRFDDYLEHFGMDIKAFRNSYRDTALKNVKARLGLEAVAVIEGMSVTEEERENEIKEMAQNFDLDASNLKESMSKREWNGLNQDIIVQKALKFITAEAVVLPPEPEKESSKGSDEGLDVKGADEPLN